MRLRTKLLLGQLPLALSLVTIAVVSYLTVRALDHNAQDILKDNHRSVLAAQRMRDAADALARRALIRPGVGSSSAEVERERAAFEQELRFQESNVTEAGEREATHRVRVAWHALQGELDETPPTNGRDALETYANRLDPALVSLRASTSEVIRLNQDAMVNKSERARRAAERISALLLIAMGVALALGFWASIFFLHRLVRPLSMLAHAVRRIGQGDLTARARVPGGDEIAEVAAEIDAMADKLAAYRSSSLGELLRAQQTAQAAIDSLSDPVLVFERGGALLGANRAASALLDVDAEHPREPLGKAGREVREVVAKMRAHVIAGNGPYAPTGFDEALQIAAAEAPRHYLPRATPLVGDDGTTGFTVVFQDVTRLRRFDQLKTDMVATVAHEFRTPLTSLRMALHLMEGAAGGLTEKQRELLGAAREDCERLQTLVTDMLDLSRIQAGRLELQPRPIGSTSLLVQALEEHRPLAHDRSLTLRIGALAVDRPVAADRERIRLVLANLVGNAVRHTPSGGTIELRAALEPDGVRFEVCDTGPGVPAEYAARLFDRFFRVPGTAGNGVGLGLFIAKEIVEAHGGRIGVASESGAGAIFWFVLPSAKA